MKITLPTHQAEGFESPSIFTLHLYRLRAIALIATVFLLVTLQKTPAQTFPPNFAGNQLATGLDPVGMEVAPDGRVFISEKNGTIRLFKNDTLLATPFITIPNVDNYNERGLQGIVLDPDFSTNHFVYVYYCYKAPGESVSHNRVSRFTAQGDVALSGSEFVLLTIDSLTSAGIHNGGSLAFKDGKLLVAVGEDGNGANAQSLTTLKGKILRLNSDGSIPTDNPYYGSTTGANQAIWALGFRNPFRIAVQSQTETIFVNDVGQGNYEEINRAIAGKNYGWPGIEGVKTTQSPPANYQDPVYAYKHSVGCAITAGEFYTPSTPQFPALYEGKYFFADYCGGWIKAIDPTTKAIIPFATGLNRPLVINTAPDGSLYFIARGGFSGGSSGANTASTNGVLWKVTYTGNGVPVVAVEPTSKTAVVGESVTFFVSASGTPTPTYQWQRNGTTIEGATATSYVLPEVTLSDNGAVFKTLISNSVGRVTSEEATLTTLVNQKPTATITSPKTSKLYTAGEVITFSGIGTDAEDGNLPPSAFSWQVDLYHYDTPAHFHPVLAATGGNKSGRFAIPTTGETSPNILYRITLTVTDSKGATATSTVDVNPVRSVITLVTQPAGLAVELDGALVSTPFTFTGVSGITRRLQAVEQSRHEATYTFYTWSDGGTATRILNTPAGATTLTATYLRSADVVPTLSNGLSYTYAEGSYFTLPDFATLTAVKTGVTPTFSLDSRNREDNFAFRFKGYINLPMDGKYTFYTRSDDGSRLLIGGTTLIDNDGVHGAIEKSGITYLKAGMQAIDVLFFERGADQLLTVSYEGPGMVKQVIPAAALFSLPLNTPRTTLLTEGFYELEPQHAIGKRLTVSSASVTDGAEVQIETASGATSQTWKLTNTGHSLYELSPQSALSSRLDVKGASTDDGAGIQIYAGNASGAQRWKLLAKGNSVYELEAQCAPGKRLAGLSKPTTDGARVMNQTATGDPGQQWKLILTSAARLAADERSVEESTGALLANYPNPFAQKTTLIFELPEQARQCMIQLHNAQGELIRSIDLSDNTEGRYVLSSDGLAAGLYMYSLWVDGKRKASKRLIITK